MTLGELLKELALGEFSNLSLASDGKITNKNRDRVVIQVNDGLLKLYNRFLLKEKDLLLEMHDGVTNYHLLKRYAYSTYDPNEYRPTFDMPYILDLDGEPFQEDVLKILEVHDAYGRNLPINVSSNPLSLFTPQGNVLQVPYNIGHIALSVVYQASHPKVSEDADEIELPPLLMMALKSYVASKVYSFMNTAENISKSIEYNNSFESFCLEVESTNPVGKLSSGTRFERNGWI